MAKEVIVPRVGEVPEATVLKWLKKEGDKVEKGEPIVEVDLFKLTKQLEAPVSGYLAKRLAKENDVIQVGSPIAVIAESEDELKELMGAKPAEVKAPPEKPPAPVAVEEKAKVEVTAAEVPKRIKISPRARRLAQQYGIDITKIKGTGPGGRIVERDVLRYIEEMRKAKEAIQPRVKEVRKLIGKRRTIAWRLGEVWKTSPHINIIGKVDLSKAVVLRKKLNEVLEKKGAHVTFTDLFVKAVAKAGNVIVPIEYLSFDVVDGKVVGNDVLLPYDGLGEAALELAYKQLKSGKSWEMMQKIIKVQKGNPDIKSEDLQL